MRPLLIAAGAAAMASSIYYLIKRSDGEKATADPEDTEHEVPVCEQATEPALIRSTKVHQDQMMEAMQVITKLEKEKFNLIHQVKTLQDRLLKSEHHEMMETLTNSEKLLKVSLAETEEKHQKAVEIISQLEEEKSDLTDQVNTLQDTVEDMENQLRDSRLQCEQEQEAHRLLKSKYYEMIETLANNEKLLKVSLSETAEKHQKTVETFIKLEEERSDLTDQVNTLQDTVKDMENQLCDYRLQCEQQQEAHRLLKSKYYEMIETLANNEKLLKVSLSETAEKHQKTVETFIKLEEERSDLTVQVNTLQDTVKDMENQLCDSRLQCEQEQEAHRLVKSEYHEMMQTLTSSEKLLQVSLAETEEKHQKAVEIINQLEEEKSDLTDQVNTLQDTVEDMGNQLFDTFRQRDQLKNDYEEEQQAHSHLKSKFHDMMEILTKRGNLMQKPDIPVVKGKRRLVPVKILDCDF
ncbi:hypothetical protein QTP70_014239 [Hemibagrus guttatus]|uniref:Uncharacterized protein n=1 Tax=Hemibagrus guttatus TaxID=175788 RepID=A0AAE0UQ19_9TELE|nr:hypothetical protein QTP70_014239 [Hemibagrus guttatus]